jgi:cytochrome c-type biogenesis protein CcmH
MKRLSIIFLLIMSSNGFAVDYRQFSNPEQQEIYETLTSELRCLVCQNQTIADSNAELAGDLRRQVYEMLEQGKTRQEILQFMTERYGDFVLYKPPFKGKTGILWIAPVIFLLMGLIAVFLFVHHKKKSSKIETSPEKQEKIRSLLEKGDQS